MRIKISERLADEIIKIDETEDYDSCAAFLALKELAEIINRTERENWTDNDLSYMNQACVAIYGEEYLEQSTR